SAIYALVTRRDFSAMHRLAQDETWHFYLGDPIELLLLPSDGGLDEVVVLGADLAAGQQPQFTVPAGVWMGARPLRDDPEAFSLFGCTLSPGFADRDYEPGERVALQAAHPAHAALIAALTREIRRAAHKRLAARCPVRSGWPPCLRSPAPLKKSSTNRPLAAASTSANSC